MSTAPVDALAHLLAPASVGPLRVRNRVVSTSHQTSLVDAHLPTDDLIAYHEARARGGVGSIFLEATAIHPTGLLTPHTLGGFRPEMVSAYRRLADAVHGHGAALLVQLFHGGREQFASMPKAPAVAPSAVPSLRFKSEPRALTRSEIRELIEGYGTAARYAREGGLDGAEVSMAHGYLPAQFLSPLSNHRGDEYDGSLSARLRFARELLEAVRAGAGERLAVGVRLAADELVDGGLGVAECIEVAQALHGDGLIDFASLVLGHSAYPAASTWIAPPPPAELNAIADPAAEIRAAVPGLTLIATTRVLGLADAERIVADGISDLVGMTRALIADPDLVRKAADGAADEIIACVGCNQSCIGHYHAGVPIGCAVNPRTGRERMLPRPVRRERGRTVLVIGGGPAGIAAAIEAAESGDAVTLIERERSLGGQLRVAGLAPAHMEMWERYVRSGPDRLARLDVEVRCGLDAAAETPEDYDVVVLATGARPYEPPLPRASGYAVQQAWRAIEHPEQIAGPALVADWGGGWDGLDAAECLALAGIEVTLACAGTHPGETLHQYQRNLYLARLDLLGVRILHHLALEGLALEGDSSSGGASSSHVLRHVYSGRSQPLPQLGTLVLAQGRVPCDELWSRLEDHPAAIRAGDVLGPRTLEEAVLEGTRAVALPARA